MPKSIGKRHAIFIQHMVEFGDTPEGQIKAYRIAFPNCRSNEAARSASSRLLRNVPINKLVQEGLLAKQQIIQDAKKKQLIKDAREKILEQDQVDAILCGIITGNITNTVKRPMFNPQQRMWEIITVDEPPSAGERINAIDKYNRRFGGYAARKLEIMDRDTVLVPGEDDDHDDPKPKA